jgi:hypothetical protein
MSIRRFTRLTNAFSKKIENHIAAIGLFHAHYNLCRTHKTLRVTPARAAGVATPRVVVELLPAVAQFRWAAKENNGISPPNSEFRPVNVWSAAGARVANAGPSG